MSRERYAVDVRAAEDGRLLGHINVSTVPWRLPPYVVFELSKQWASFELREHWARQSEAGQVLSAQKIKTATLKVDKYFDNGVSVPAFCVPAAEWEEIKDKI